MTLYGKKIKFHIEILLDERAKYYPLGQCHLTKMADMPMNSKILTKY